MEEMMENLAAIALSSSSCLQYLELSVSTRDQDLQNSEDMMLKLLLNYSYSQVMLRKLLWNYNFSFQHLEIVGMLPELVLLFEPPPQLPLHTQMDVSSIRITRLTLWESKLGEDPMPFLEKIATLRDLYLHVHTFVGEEMICSATGFPQLSSLILEFLPNLVKWRVEEGSMPVLSTLGIIHCSKLEELPEGMKYLNSLQSLTLYGMPLDFCDKLSTENGEQGADFYKVAHIPSFKFLQTE